MEENDQNVRTGEEMEAGPSQIIEESEADSPLCSSLEPKHKVFLSHSGAQKDFVEQLCIELERWHRFPFFDKRRSSLPIGERFPGLIFDAIHQCHVGVLVLSKEFFERSKWPMLELVAMVREKKKPNSRIRIVPVFYHISREEWQDANNRNTWISQWEIWADEDERIKVGEWKEALENLKPINSMVMDKSIGEVSCRAKIVEEVCNLVPPETRWDDSHVQGKVRMCKIINEKIGEHERRNEVQVVGLYGMGGIGKTTICKAMCNEMSQDFHGRICHVELKSGSEVDLLREVLRRLTDTRPELLGELNIDQCRDQVKRCMKKDAVFLAIENVSNDLEVIRQAKTYLGAGWGNGSVLVVTARSLEELMCLNQYLDEGDCMGMPELEKDEATCLFVSHAACGRSAMIELDEGLVSRCVERCYFSKGEGMGHHYIPLALQVLGEQLGSIGYDVELWDAQLMKIDTFDRVLLGNKHPIFSVLRSSYDSLTDGDKMLFMDVALFFPTYDQEGLVAWYHQYTLFDWLSMVHGSNVEEMMRRLGGLKRKSLLENLGSGITRIGMHDLWREFCLAETRLGKIGDQRWLYVEEGSSELGEVSPAGRCRESVRRMCFLDEGWRCLNGEQLEDYVNVSVLKLDIEWLVAPSELDLDLTGMKHLKSLEMRTRRLNAKFVGFDSLKKLVFLRWTNDGEASIPCIEEIGRLTKLQVLEVAHLDGSVLPDLSRLASLRVASFRYCFNVLTIRGLSSKLTNLRHLELFNCHSLVECPGVGELYNLEELILTGCFSLKELPCLRVFTKLRALCIYECTLLKAVRGLSDLVALEWFAAGSSGLASLPDMSKLTKLRLLMCSNLPRLEAVNLGELPRLEEMDFAGCSAMKTLTCERPFGALVYINLSLCSGLEEMPDLVNFPQLNELRLSGCARLGTLASSKPVHALRYLDLEGCGSLSALPDHLCSSVKLLELRLQQSGVELSAEYVQRLKASCKWLVVFPNSARSRYGEVSTDLDEVSTDEVDDVELHAQRGYRSRRLPDSSPRHKVTKLVYTNAGDSILALTSDGMHKLWDWGEWSSSEAGYKLWRHSSGSLMINDINNANPGEVGSCMAISENDEYAISASGGKVSLFELRAFEVLQVDFKPRSQATSLAFNPSDIFVVVIGMEDSTIDILKVHANFDIQVVCTLKGHEKRITCLAFSETLNVMVSLGADAQLCMWRTEGWMERPSYFVPLQPDAKSGCVGDIRVQFHSNGVHVLVVGDSVLAVYDAVKLDCLCQWVLESPYIAAISDAVYSCDGHYIFTSFCDGCVGVMYGESLEPVCRFAPPLHRPQGVSGSTVYPLVLAAHPKASGVLALGLSNGDVLEISPWAPPHKGSGSGELSGAEGPDGDSRSHKSAQVLTTGDDKAKKPSIR